MFVNFNFYADVPSPTPTPIVIVIESSNKAPGVINYLDVEGSLQSVANYLALEFTTDNSPTLNDVIAYLNTYTSAGLLLQDEAHRASMIAAYEFLNDILTSERFEQLRGNIAIRTIDDLEVLVSWIILSLDFDRSIGNVDFYHKDETTIDIITYSEQEYYSSHLQILLVQRLLEEGRRQVLEKYEYDGNIVINGELTDIGKMLSFLVPLSYTGASRLAQDTIPVLTTPDLFVQISGLVNNIKLSYPQQRFAESVIDLEPPYQIFPNYGTIYPGQDKYDYFNNLLNGVTNEVDVRVLYFKRNPDDSIDIYIQGNINQMGTDEPSGSINVRSVNQMYNSLYGLFPLSDKGRFLIGRHNSIYMGRTEQNKIFASVLPIFQYTPMHMEAEFLGYNPEEYLLPQFRTVWDDPGFESSRDIFNIISVFGRIDDYQTGLTNIGDLTSILDLNVEQMYELAGTSRYIPYEKNRFIEWLNRLVEGNMAILNPTFENLTQDYPNSFRIAFDGDRVFVIVNTPQGAYGISTSVMFEATDEGFIETHWILSENSTTYMIPLNDFF